MKTAIVYRVLFQATYLPQAFLFAAFKYASINLHIFDYRPKNCRAQQNAGKGMPNSWLLVATLDLGRSSYCAV